MNTTETKHKMAISIAAHFDIPAALSTSLMRNIKILNATYVANAYASNFGLNQADVRSYIQAYKTNK